MASDFMTRFAAAIGRPRDSFDAGTSIRDLDVDSFALVDVLVRLQEELGVRIFQEDLAGVETVGDLQRVFERPTPPPHPS
jgi:acyl carrier protein